MKNELELAPGIVELTDMLAFEEAWKNADESFCHIKYGDPGPYICGQGFGAQHDPTKSWFTEHVCGGCGRPICPDCLFVARR